MIKTISYLGLGTMGSGQDGDCPNCESYKSRFAELLEPFESNERKSIASSQHVKARQ
jgi:hypothetical protein